MIFVLGFVVIMVYFSVVLCFLIIMYGFSEYDVIFGLIIKINNFYKYYNIIVYK